MESNGIVAGASVAAVDPEGRFVPIKVSTEGYVLVPPSIIEQLEAILKEVKELRTQVSTIRMAQRSGGDY